MSLRPFSPDIMAGPKFDPPELTPRMGAQGFDSDGVPFFGLGCWPRRDPPDRVETSKVGSAAKIEAENTE